MKLDADMRPAEARSIIALWIAVWIIIILSGVDI